MLRASYDTQPSPCGDKSAGYDTRQKKDPFSTLRFSIFENLSMVFPTGICGEGGDRIDSYVGTPSFGRRRTAFMEIVVFSAR